MKHTRMRLAARAIILAPSKNKVDEAELVRAMKERSDAAEKIMDIADKAFNREEIRRLSGLMSEFILGPINRVQYKSHLPERFREYPFLTRTQLRRRKAREVSYDARRKYR